ncbi:MAG: hypothetical protein K2Q09_11605, partial [Phycisphaerales bacterium]|nr:hypothetical protein [Phycisphaerales bacterium]
GARPPPPPAGPECGWRGKRRRAYLRSRRRWVWAGVAVAAAVAGAACGVTPKARRDGVWSVAPTWAMWAVVRTGSVPGGGFARELAVRAGAGESLRAAAERVYGWVPSVRLTRERGVRGVPLRAGHRSVMGHGLVSDGLRFSPTVYGVNDADVTSVQSHENWWTVGKWILMPAPGSGDDVLVARLHCESPVAVSGERWAEFVVRVPLAASIDDVMKPVEVPGADVLAALNFRVFVLPTTRNLALSVGEVSEGDIGDGTALGVKVDITRASGEIVARGRWYQAPGPGGNAMGGRPVLLRFVSYGPGTSVNGPMTYTLDELLAAGCTARFSTDEEMALAAPGCDAYWRGNFEVPLKDLVK